MKITEEMTRVCYETAKAIHDNKSGIKSNAKSISKFTGMNSVSARDYLQGFFCMMSGEKMKRAMAEKDIRYYFTRICSEYGREALQHAVNSLQGYLDNDNQKHPSLQKVIDEFTENYLK